MNKGRSTGVLRPFKSVWVWVWVGVCVGDWT